MFDNDKTTEPGIPNPSASNPPARSKVYKNAQGVEIEENDAKKWGLRLAFYAVYYTFIYLLYLYSISIITSKTHAPGMKVPVTQARLGTPRMTLFPLDQIREIDWAPRSGVDNHLWYKSDKYGGKTMSEAYKDLLQQRLDSMVNTNFSSAVASFCDGDYKEFKNGKACLLAGVNTVVNWQPVKLVPGSVDNWFNAKLTTDGSSQAFSLESQGLSENEDADIMFGCRVFATRYDADQAISRPVSEGEGFIMNNSSGIEWMNNENYLKNFTPFTGGINPKSDKTGTIADIYDECEQPSFSAAKCNINQYDYTSWEKPFTAVKIDMNQIHTDFQANGVTEEAQRGYEFKCNAYAQNIVTSMYDENTKLYYEGDNGKPIVQSGGKELHQNFIIQFEN